MVERKIDERIMNAIQQFINAVSKDYKIDSVYLFGSYARGTQHKDSDIDIAIISKDVKDRLDDMAKMFGYTWSIGENIEPHPDNTSEFNAEESILASEVLRTGIKIA